MYACIQVQEGGDHQPIGGHFFTHITQKMACNYKLLHQACVNGDISFLPLMWTQEC